MSFDSGLSKLILKLCEHHLQAFEQQLDALVKHLDDQFGWVRLPLLVLHLKQADYYLSTSSPEQLKQAEGACQDFLEHVKVRPRQTLRSATHMRKRAASTEVRKSLDPLPEAASSPKSNPFDPPSSIDKVKVKMQIRSGHSERKGVFFPYYIWLDECRLYWQALGDDLVKSSTLRGVTLENPKRLTMKLEVEDEVKTVVFAEAQAYSEWGDRSVAALRLR
jgi:hypothetical protein